MLKFFLSENLRLRIPKLQGLQVNILDFQRVPRSLFFLFESSSKPFALMFLILEQNHLEHNSSIR